MRIVSLISSATEMVYALGMESFLVGRSHECDFPPAVLALPCCTEPRIPVNGSSLEIDTLVKQSAGQALSLYSIFDDVLERLQPTHILTQTQCDVCAVSLADVEKSVASKLASRPRIVSLQPNTLADIWDDMRRIAAALGVPERGEIEIQSLVSQMNEIAVIAAQAKVRRRVACIEWLSPLMAAGNWVPELVDLAGAINLFGEAGKHSPWMTWDALLESRPDVTIAMPCGFTLQRTLEEMYWMTEHPQYLDLSGNLYATDGNNYFNRPGPRVVDSLRLMASMIYPELFPQDPAFQRIKPAAKDA